MTDNPGGEATALLDRKLKLLSASDCRPLFAELETVDAEIEQHGRNRLDIDQRLTSAQAGAAEAEQLVCLTVEGKNETERKAHKAQLLREDPAHRAAMNLVRDIERQRDEAELSVESLKRKARRIERTIEYRIAALRMIGG